MTTSIRGLAHIVLRVTSIDRAKAFYVDTLQFPIVVERPDRILLNVYGTIMALVGDDPHTAKDDRFNPFRVGLDHLALNVPNKEVLSVLLDMLNQAGIPNNGIELDAGTNADYISFYDPDGIAWEFYVTPTRGE